MKASPKLRRLLCLVLCFVMVLQPMTCLAVTADAAELIVNGTFADADGDSKADGWTYCSVPSRNVLPALARMV